MRSHRRHFRAPGRLPFFPAPAPVSATAIASSTDAKLAPLPRNAFLSCLRKCAQAARHDIFTVKFLFGPSDSIVPIQEETRCKTVINYMDRK